MAGVRFYVTPICLAAIIGIISCNAEEKCTSEIVDRCYRNPVPGKEAEDDCWFYRAITKCLLKLEDKCTGTSGEEYFRSQLEFSREHGSQCPGLPDGTCYFNIANPCINSAPWDVMFKKSLSSDEKKKQCKEFLGPQAKGIKDCIRSLKPKCQPYMEKRINKDIKEIEEVEELCAKYS